MDGKEIMRSKTMRMTTIIVGVLLVSLVSFAGGLAVGFHKARFSYAFGENYERNFIGGGRDDMMGDFRGMPFAPPRNFDGSDFRNGHGLVGDILSLTDNSLVVKDASGKENMVSVNSGTQIRGGQNNMGIADLQVGDKIAVIGKPGDNGVVNADFIRVLGKNN